MAVGATGVGKSTLMNSIIQGNDMMDMNEHNQIIAKQNLIYKDREVFKIGHKATSCTESPEFILTKGIYCVDCPGLDD